MKTFKVNADFQVNVETLVEADDEEEAKRLAMRNIYNQDIELLDPITEPKINWVELEDDDSEPDRQCQYCGEESCDCDLL